jgi:hypothetical protein
VEVEFEVLKVTGCSVTFNGTKFKMYINGALDYTENITGIIKDSSGVNVYLGKSVYDNFPGLMDEARISGKARSADWIKLSYETQRIDQTIVH